MKQLERKRKARKRLSYARDPVRLTALLYLQENLLNEHYEECDQCIQVALEFGATTLEIQDLLEDPRRTPRG